MSVSYQVLCVFRYFKQETSELVVRNHYWAGNLALRLHGCFVWGLAPSTNVHEARQAMVVVTNRPTGWAFLPGLVRLCVGPWCEAA